MTKHRISIKNWPLDDQPRERFKKYGPSRLTNSELLAILIGTGNWSKGETALDLARSLLNKYGDFKGLSAANMSQITKFSGLGQVKAIKILAALEIGRRLCKSDSMPRSCLENGQMVFETYRHHIGQLQHEVFMMLVLNARNQVIAEERLAEGIVSAVVVRPREVFALALAHRAVSVLFLHNHPSGNLQPSQEDFSITSRLKKAGDLLGVRVLDHLIITAEGYKSVLKELKTPFN